MQAMLIWKKILKELSSQLEKLLELRNDVKQEVEVAEGEQMKPMEQVQGWLKRVEECEKEVNKLINMMGIRRSVKYMMKVAIVGIASPATNLGR